jgi:peptide/nickel transport system substrate-binding protein
VRISQFILLLSLIVLMIVPAGCRRQSGAFVIAIGDNIRTIDPIGSPSTEAASERLRTLMFNTLVKKNEQFDYVGELASDIKRSDDGLTFTFTLRDGVKFHDGRPFSSADAKYTLDFLLASDFGKAASFFEGTGQEKRGYIKGVDAPDPKTLVVTLTKPWVGLLSNLVAIPIIAKDSYDAQKTHPMGTGPFKFIKYDNSQQICDLEAFPEYWEGAPKLQLVRVRAISDMNAMQAELQAGRVDIAPLPTSLSPDAVNRLGQDPNLQVKTFNGSNVVLLTINTSSPPVDNAKVRQAIAYGIDRQTMVNNLLKGYGKVAHSIIPEESWSYSPGQTYSFDQAAAKRLLDEAGFRDPDGDGPRMRFDKPIRYGLSGTSIVGRDVSVVVQNQLKEIGVPIEIQTYEGNTLIDEMRRGNFQIGYSQWVGGNQDPIFYKDLFATSEIPTQTRSARNRSRYSNPELDKLLEEAVNTFDRSRAKELYTRIQEIVSRDVPVFPLWYQSNIVIARKNVGNIQVNASGDWGFVRNLTREGQ